MAADYQTLDIIEEITRNDGSTYKEIGNLLHNGQAEYAAEQGMIQSVRILKINIPHSGNVENTKSTLMNILKYLRWLPSKNTQNGLRRPKWMMLSKKFPN